MKPFQIIKTIASTWDRPTRVWVAIILTIPLIHLITMVPVVGIGNVIMLGTFAIIALIAIIWAAFFVWDAYCLIVGEGARELAEYTAYTIGTCGFVYLIESRGLQVGAICYWFAVIAAVSCSLILAALIWDKAPKVIYSLAFAGWYLYVEPSRLFLFSFAAFMYIVWLIGKSQIETRRYIYSLKDRE